MKVVFRNFDIQIQSYLFLTHCTYSMLGIPIEQSPNNNVICSDDVLSASIL